MEDISEFDNRESVIHAAFQVLEKEGVDLSASSPCSSRRNPSPQCINEVSCFLFVRNSPCNLLRVPNTTSV